MRKSIQHMLFLALCLLMPSIPRAAVISVEEAKDVASEFFQSGANHRLADKDALVLAYTAVDEKSNPISYVFNAKDGNGFVIISADEEAMPVIGYSYDGTWDAGSVPGAAGELLSDAVEIQADSRLRSAMMHADGDNKLLTTPSWSQEAPFNNKIPNRRLTGCVGVALAEILKYHGCPAARPASMATDGVTSYDWAAMRDDNYRSGYSQEEAEAVATLVADAAIGIGTDFGMSSSSAYEVKVPYALTFLFGYDAGVSYKKRSELSKSVWDEIIVNEINENRPVLYSGQDVSAGHAFVCDGYEIRGGVPYFHINWGWGGSANGYYASDALNPVVSKKHSYNDLMTIIYNIKPAQSATKWSDIHITSDERQPGLTLDVDDITSAASFGVRAGSLKNISNTDFSGKLAVALFDASGKQKALLNDGRNFSLIALQIQKVVDFSCKVPSGVAVADGDVVRLVTQASGSSEWLPVSGDLLAGGEASAKNYSIPYFYVTLPGESADYEVANASDRVIKGRDYTFTVTPLSADKVVTVKANGFILTPDANNGYRVSNVLEDQKITMVVQDAKDVLTKKVVWVSAGNLQNQISETEAASVTDLTIFGTINANDFNFMRDRMKIERLDISQTSIVACGAQPANAIPTKAFQNYRSLKQILLPSNLTTFKNGCFNNTGLTSIDIPASVATWEYNVFLACYSLQEVIVRRSSPAWINWCVFNGDPRTLLIVPNGAAAAYQAKEYWQDFKEIREGLPELPSTFSVTVAEKKGLNFTSITEGTQFNRGDQYKFQVETDNTFEDAVMQVYANSTRLNADADGVYTASINGNTLIHVEFQQPQATTVDQTWKLTGEGGGIGLVTDVVNVPFGKTFTVRANAIKIPKGDDAAKFYGLVLTDKNGAIKEFISTILSNYYSRAEAVTSYNFYCQVKEASIKEGNQIRLATSYNKKDWQLVVGDADSIQYSLAAVGNQVAYHNVTMPSSVTGAKIEGATTQVVRGMPFTIKASAINPAQRVTVGVNGDTKAFKVANANVTIPAVLEDLDVTILVQDADAGDYMVFNISEGQLASKLAEDCPARVKLVGSMYVSDFNALRAKASTIIDLDMADVTIKGAAMTGNQLPENAFAPTSSSDISALKTVILPNNLERIDKNAFARCTQITELTIPANVSYIGAGAFSACIGLNKITANPKVAPTCGNTSPFHSNPSAITLVVPKGSEESYSVPSTWWAMCSLYKTPAEHKDYYWIKINESYVKVLDYKGSLSSIGVGASDMEIIFELPNVQQTRMKKDNRTHIRPGVAFKIYDNGVDVFANLGQFEYENGSQRIFPYQHWSMTAGKFGVRYLHNRTSGPWMPQNHEIDINFYYNLNFEIKDGAQGIKAETIDVPESNVWRNVQMSWFQQQVTNQWGSLVGNTEVKPILYREQSEIKFQLTNIPEKTQPVVKVIMKVMTKPGEEPVYEERETELEGDNGIYTLPALQGDCRVLISGIKSYEEGDPIPADALSNMSKEDVISFTELTVTGEMGEEEFENIREKFDGVEILDLSQIENEVIPEGAFAGMENLSSVTIPPTVTEIGAGAFAGCENIGTITLPGVNSIGEGAFEGCTSLTSILIPSSGTSSSPAGAPRKIARSGSGITAESFRGLNPNCLIYVGETEIPDSEDLNIILNQKGVRVAASDIHIDGNYSFNAPASFNLGSNKISFTAHVTGSDACDVNSGWMTIMLPFQPTEMVIGEKFAEREGSGIHFLSFADGEATEFTAPEQMLPNRPYLANICAPYESVPVTFTASAREQKGDEIVYDVPFTPVAEETVAAGKEFSLYGSYDGTTRPVQLYLLNEEGSRFERVDGQNITVRPYSAYLVANDGTVKDGLDVGEHPLWIHEPATAGSVSTKLYRSNLIDLSSITRKASVYYTMDGSEPTAESALYTEPFALESESLNIKAVAEYKGYKSDVVDLTFELKKANVDLNLVENWNWISHNAESAVEVKTFATDGISRILSQTQEAIADPKLGIVGNLTEIAPAAGYKVFVEGKSWKGNISGVAYDPADSIFLHKGWNWIGTGVDEGSLLISDLLSGLNAEEGEMLVGLDGFVQVDAEGTWAGTLSHMTPGEGYMLLANSDKAFAFAVTHAAEAKATVKKAPVAGENSRWTVDNHKYASVMPVVAELTLAGGTPVDAADYQVAAFCGNECRGIGAVVNGKVMINVHGNAGDMISFRIIDAFDQEKVSETAMAFNVDNITTFSAPVAINVENTTSVKSIDVAPFTVISENGAISFGGDVDAVESVEIYDVAGVLLTRSASAGKVSGLGTGVVLVVVRTADATFYQKVLVK